MLIFVKMLFLLVEAAPAAFVLVPLFLFLQEKYWHSKRRTVLYLVFSLYLCGVYIAAGLPHIWNFTYQPRINLTFFAYMFTDFSTTLNVFFFVPLGFLLPLIWNRYCAIFRTVPFGFFLSLTIEVLQIFTHRATDVNDLMTNTLGAVIGYAIAMLLQWFFPALKSDNDSKDVYWICGVVAATMFFVHPILSYVIF